VQRLIQNEVDGKLVETEQSEKNEKTVEVASAFRFNKKLETLNMEYNTILLKTLDEQKQFYENKLQEIKKGELAVYAR
jgi:hypothetical protein